MSRHLARYSTAYIRGGLYAAVAFLSAFIAQFENMPPAQIASLTGLGWSVAWAKVILPCTVTMRAFFDGTMERIKPPDTPSKP